MAITDDRLCQGPLDPNYVPTAGDECRGLGVRFMVGMFKCANMADALDTRNPALCLETLRAARAFWVEHFGSEGEMMLEFVRAEAKLMRAIELQGRKAQAAGQVS